MAALEHLAAQAVEHDPCGGVRAAERDRVVRLLGQRDRAGREGPDDGETPDRHHQGSAHPLQDPAGDEDVDIAGKAAKQ